MAWLALLTGYRTYLLAAVYVVLIAVTDTGLVPAPLGHTLQTLLAPLIAVTIRSAIARIRDELRRQPPDPPAPSPTPAPVPGPAEPLDLSVFNTAPTPETQAALQQRVAMRVYTGGEEQSIAARYNAAQRAALVGLMLCAWPALAAAAPPRASIDGPSTVRYAGQKLVLRAGDDGELATHFRWRITPTIDGYEQITPLDDDAATVLIHTMAGRYIVTLIASNADGSDDAALEITVPGDSPNPTPPVPPEPRPGPAPGPGPRPQPAPEPAPGPTPDPVLPRGEFQIAQPVYLAVRSIQDPQRAANATRLAEAAEGLAARIAAGAITSRQAVVTAIVEAMRPLPESWAPLNRLTRDSLQTLVTSGQLDTVDRWAVLLREIATGLRAAAR